MSTTPLNRAQRREAAKRGKRNQSIPGNTVNDAIQRAKSAGKKADGPPDGATIMEPTPEQIAAAQDAAVQQNAGAASGAIPGADDMPPLDQLPPEVAKQIEQMQANMGRAAAAADALSPPKSNSRRHKKYIDLEKELAVILTLPAAPFEMAGDQYCAMHFAMQGPMLAHRLTLYAESHDATFELLARIVEAGGIATLIIAIAGYALPPMLHHGLPAPQGLRSMYGVPDKAPKQEVVDD